MFNTNQIYKKYALSIIVALLLVIVFAYVVFRNEIENLKVGYGGGGELVAIIIMTLFFLGCLFFSYAVLIFGMNIALKLKFIYLLSFITILLLNIFLATRLGDIFSSGVIGVASMLIAILVSPKLAFSFTKKIS